MNLRRADISEFESIRSFYWNLIDAMRDRQGKGVGKIYYEDTSWSEYAMFEFNL